METMKKLSNEVKAVLDDAIEICRDFEHTKLNVDHIFLSLLRNNRSLVKAIKPDITEDKVTRYIRIARDTEFTYNYNAADVMIEGSLDTKVLIKVAETIAEECGSEKVEVTHLLIAILQTESDVMNRILQVTGIKKEESVSKVMDLMLRSNDSVTIAWKPIDKIPDGLKVCKDLTRMAYEGKIDPVFGRKNETERMIQILCRRTKNNPVLVGNAGTGKTSCIEGLAQKIVEGNVPEKLKGKTILSLNMGSMVAGSKYRGEFEERIKNLLEELSSRDDIILFIDEIHTIVGAGNSGGEGSIDASNMMKPALARGEIKVIGSTTFDEYSRYIQKDKALDRRFQKVNIEEPNFDATKEIVEGVKYKYEDYHNVRFSTEIVEKSIELANKYITDRYQPDKTIDLMDEVCSRVSLSRSSSRQELVEVTEHVKQLEMAKERYIREENYALAAGTIKEIDKETETIKRMKDNLDKENKDTVEVTSEDIAKVIEMWTGIPATKMLQSEMDKLKNLEDDLRKKVIGQDEAIAAVAKSIRRNRAGLGDPNKPIGTFFMSGPSGTGKTHLVKTLAANQFDSEENIVRIDCSELMEAHTVSKLIGSPAGLSI